MATLASETCALWAWITKPSGFSFAAKPGKAKRPARIAAMQGRAKERITPPECYLHNVGALWVRVNPHAAAGGVRGNRGLATRVMRRYNLRTVERCVEHGYRRFIAGDRFW